MVDDKELDEWIAKYGSEREALRAILDTLEVLHMEIYNCQMVIGQQRDIINDFKEINKMDTKYLTKYSKWDEIEEKFAHWVEYLPDDVQEIAFTDPKFVANAAFHEGWRSGEEYAVKIIIKALDKHIRDIIDSNEGKIASEYENGIEDAIDLIRKWWKIVDR